MTSQMCRRNSKWRKFAWVLTAVPLAVGAAKCGAPDDGFTPLFPKDGVPKDWLVREWRDVSKPVPAYVVWTVKDGVLQTGKQRGTWLMSPKEYADFELMFEIKLTERG